MGVFGYECACGGKTCNHVGNQEIGDDVIIEVPLKDGTVTYLQGVYDGYGAVHAEDTEFFLYQFKNYFESWLLARSITGREVYLANRIWTEEEDYWPSEEIDRMLVVKPGRIHRPCFDEICETITTINPATRKDFVLVDGGITEEDGKRREIEERNAAAKLKLIARLETIRGNLATGNTSF
jgi:hypothetical protein